MFRPLGWTGGCGPSVPRPSVAQDLQQRRLKFKPCLPPSDLAPFDGALRHCEAQKDRLHRAGSGGKERGGESLGNVCLLLSLGRRLEHLHIILYYSIVI